MAMTPSEVLGNLQSQQFDEKEIKKLLKEVQRLGGDEEAIKALLNTKLPKIIGTGRTPKIKAYLTDRLLQQIMGTAALEEIPGLAELPPEDAIKKALHEAYGDISKLEKELGISSDVSFEGFNPQRGYFQSAGDYGPQSGIRINEAFKKDPALLAQMLGTGFHEGSHRPNYVSTALQALANKDLKKDIDFSKYGEQNVRRIRDKIANRIIDQEVLDFYKANNISGYETIKRIADAKKLGQPNIEKADISELVKEYTGKNPGKLDDTKEILNWQGLAHKTDAQFDKSIKDLGIKNPNDLSFLQLQDILSGKEASHWFKKNFPLEGVLGLAKSGVKGIRSIAPVLKPIAKMLPLAAAYSNYSEAKEQGLPAPIAAAYAGAEELNPLPISGIDYYKGIEQAAEGRRKNIESMYKPEEMKVEEQAKENYKKSSAAKDRALARIRNLLKPSN
jgi:hypothetical protein